MLRRALRKVLWQRLAQELPRRRKERLRRRVAEEDKGDGSETASVALARAQRDVRGAVDGVLVHATADGGERDGADGVCGAVGELQRAPACGPVVSIGSTAIVGAPPLTNGYAKCLTVLQGQIGQAGTAARNHGRLKATRRLGTQITPKTHMHRPMLHNNPPRTSDHKPGNKAASPQVASAAHAETEFWVDCMCWGTTADRCKKHLTET